MTQEGPKQGGIAQNTEWSVGSYRMGNSRVSNEMNTKAQEGWKVFSTHLDGANQTMTVVYYKEHW